MADVGPAKKGWQEASKTLYNMTKGKELRANVRSNEACRLDVDLFAKNPSKPIPPKRIVVATPVPTLVEDSPLTLQ